MTHFRFKEGESVALATPSYAKLGIGKGAVGKVWMLYASNPPLYEVEFVDKRNGEKFDITLEEDELLSSKIGSL